MVAQKERQMAPQNGGPLSKVMAAGTPNRVTHGDEGACTVISGGPIYYSKKICITFCGGQWSNQVHMDMA